MATGQRLAELVDRVGARPGRRAGAARPDGGAGRPPRVQLTRGAPTAGSGPASDMRAGRCVSSVACMSTDPQRFEILLVPEHVEGSDAASLAESAIRSAVVEATGRHGSSGYPRYAGDGVVADIDPATRTVEALLVDGRSWTTGLTAVVRPWQGLPGGAFPLAVPGGPSTRGPSRHGTLRRAKTRAVRR